MPPEYHLGELHTVVQLAMGWLEYHLHEFHVRGTTVSRDEFELDDEPVDERQMTVAQAFPRGKGSIGYVYDFGDFWRHSIRCEGKVARTTAPQIPYCSAGKRSRPPEDVGGLTGYANLLRILSDPTDEEREEYLEWCGGTFDPDGFDREFANNQLAIWEQAGRRYLEEMDQEFKDAFGQHGGLTAWPLCIAPNEGS